MKHNKTKTGLPFSHGSPPGVGILIVNLGTPDAPTAAALRRYLAEFLADRRVVEIPRPLWLFILYAFILPFRPQKSAQKYATIWSEEGSPLLAITRRQVTALRADIEQQFCGPIKVVFAMRYGNPSIASALQELQAAPIEKLLVLPMYPQYSATTTGSSFDAISKELRRWRRLPELRMINHYHDNQAYITALAENIRTAQQQQVPEKLLFSFHGLPKRNLLLGDPYFCECQKTGRLLAEELQLAEEQWAVAFQSRFGRAEWLKPYTSETLKSWARQGISSVDVACPGFPADCLETLEEIAIENRDIFLQAGGRQFRYLPALNDDPGHIAALLDIITRHAAGWPHFAPDYDRQQILEDVACTRQRALSLGAND